MYEGIIASRYARALFELLRPEEWDEALAELRELARLITSNEVQHFFSSNAIPYDEKQTLLERLVSSLELIPIVNHFLCVLLRRGRFSLLTLVCGELKDFILTARNAVMAEVCTAATLEPHEEEQFRQKLHALTGKNIECTFKQDPKLICGGRAEVGGKIYDFSLPARIAQLRRALRERM